MALTDIQVRNAKFSIKTKKVSDSNGLQIWINPTGSKLWRYACRFGDKQKLLSLGAYPEISLAAARIARDEAHRPLTVGIDPSEQRKTNKLIQADTNATTFDLIAKELLEKKKREGKAEATLIKVEWIYKSGFTVHRT